MPPELIAGPETASTFARDVDHFYYFMVGLSAFFTFAISAAILFFAIRYRRRSRLQKGQDLYASPWLEVIWSIIPFVLTMVMFFWSAHLFFRYAKAPPGSAEILVTGKQWMWKIQHPNGKREINELHVPAGQPVKLTMTSEDVIHSFFIPAFRTKMDVLPGRYTSMWFHPTKPGKYRLFCAEYCGTEHSKMGGWVYVMTPTEYENWLGGVQAGESLEAAGAKLFTSLGCIACHGGTPGALGPAMAGVFGKKVKLADGSEVVADENYVRESILTPNAKIVEGFLPVMPPFQGMVNETQLIHLIAYIKSIGSAPAAH